MDQPSVRLINLPIDREISRFVWIASDEKPLSKSYDGYLFVCESGYNSTLHVFEVDLERILSRKAHKREITLQHLSKITPLENTRTFCPIGTSTIVASFANANGQHKPVLLELEYQNVH